MENLPFDKFLELLDQNVVLGIALFVYFQYYIVGKLNQTVTKEEFEPFTKELNATSDLALENKNAIQALNIRIEELEKMKQSLGG